MEGCGALISTSDRVVGKCVLACSWLAVVVLLASMADGGELAWSDSDCEDVAVSKLVQAEVGQRIGIDAIVEAIVGQRWVLVRSPVPARVRGLDANLEGVAPGRALSLFGFVDYDDQGRLELHVRRYVPIEVHVEIRKRSQAAERAMDARITKLYEAHQKAELVAYAEELRETGSLSGRLGSMRAYAEALKLERTEFDPVNVGLWQKQRVEDFASRSVSWLGDLAGAREILATYIYAHPQERVALGPRMERLGAIVYGADRRYLSCGEIKRLEGCVQYRGRWLSGERADLLRSVEQQLVAKDKPRGWKLPEYFAKISASGQVVLGMNKREVGSAIGFPDRVERVRRAGKLFDSWIYYGYAVLVFEDGICFGKRRLAADVLPPESPQSPR